MSSMPADGEKTMSVKPGGKRKHDERRVILGAVRMCSDDLGDA